MFRNFIIIFIMLTSAALADVGLINQYDQKKYSPATSGVKDLVFEVRLKNLAKDLKERFALTKVSDPHFVVYWLSPGKTAVDVRGLPPGFDALKNELKKVILMNLEYVVPQDMAPRFRSYEFKELKKNADEVVVRGTDRTQGNFVSEVELAFNTAGILTNLKSMTPAGTENVSFKSSKKTWSHSKDALDETVTSIKQVGGVIENKTTISYENYNGVGLPESITTISTIKIENEEVKEQGSATLNFSEYKINSGDAQKFFTRQDASE